ncbi:hypothetical protein COP2_010347 [Malus domestica]
MSNLNKLDFTALKLSGRNYLKWIQDVKFHLTAKNLRPTIEDEMGNPVGEDEKVTAMIFMAHCKPSTLLGKIHEHSRSF